VTVYSETRRQIVHITMAVFALPLAYLTWQQAALMAAGALAFNAFLLPKIAPGILRSSDARGMRAGVLFYPLSVLLLILAFRHRLDLAAAAWGVMAFGDGFATLAGRLIGGPCLPWNRDKSWSGLLAFVVAGGLGAVALGLWIQTALNASGVDVVHNAQILPLTAAAALAAVIAGFAETLPIGLDDNLTVPAVAGSTLWFLSLLNWLGPPDSLALDLLLGTLIATPLAALAWFAGSITFGGAIVGIVLAAFIYAGLALAGVAVLAVALALTVASSRFGRARKVALGISEERGGRRGFGNVVANCSIGTLGAVLEIFSFDWGLALAGAWMAAGIAAGASDTVASEIGKAMTGTPRAFPSLRPVVAGTPGAFTIGGTLAGIAAAALIVLPAALMWLIPWTFLIPIVVACTVAAFVESALATGFEKDGVLDNHTMNFLNTAVAAALAVWWCSLIGNGPV
jgi:uncharacterized protein (TIGR00297 family)